MSGGFFRGTSADQDTRFSNKQAKLLKSQKFAPELENLVDMTKVKMDVMRPWIAHRVTELLGFEDEVLINFVYGLLEEKVVNGKKIQISLTGFMEKNTGKFMKELWTHLLSAQKNASGVPQQFLDAKEEETRKNQADRDRITSELRRTKEKEGRELEQGRMKYMDGEADNVKAASLETHSRSRTRVSSNLSADEKEANERDGSRGRNRISRSSYSADRSLSPPRGGRSKSISMSNSRSHSRSRSFSASPRAVQRSLSSERRRRSPSRQSITPRRVDSPLRSLSPPRWSSHLRRYRSRPRHRSPPRARRRLSSPVRHKSRSPLLRRSTSPMWHRSRSPLRRRSRSPIRRRSRSPIRRSSRSPIRRRSRSPISRSHRRSRSPIRRRSRSPIQRRSRSPIRRRSRSPIRRRSPSPFVRRSRPTMRYRSRSPVGRRSRSPLRHISQSPMHSRSSSSVRRRSPSPMRRRYRRAPSTPIRRSPSPVRRRTTFPGRRRSSSPGSMSPSPQGRISQSPIHLTPPSLPRRRSPKGQQRSPMRSPRDGHRIVHETSPVRQAPLQGNAGRTAEGRKRSGSLGVRSRERDPKAPSSYSRVPGLSSSPYNSPSSSGSPPTAGRRIPSKERSPIPPLRQREIVEISDGVEVEETKFSRGKKDEKSNSLGKVITHSSTNDKNKDPFNNKGHKKKHSPERLASHHTSEIQAQKKKSSGHDVERRRYPENSQELHTPRDMSSERVFKSEKGYRADGIDDSLTNDVKGSPRKQEAEKMPKLSNKVERNDQSGSLDSGSEESDELRGDVEKRKHKRSKRKDVASDNDHSHDCQERKEAKRRRKQEKRLKKEEKRRRREERRRRKEDRRTEKLKLKTGCDVSPHSEPEKNYDGYASDGEQIAKSGAIVTDNEQALSDEKKLEIQLREKALRSLRAKKGVGH